MITKLLPEFKVVEVNNLTGLRNGHVVAQMKADNSIIGGKDYVENGIIMGLNSDGTLGAYDGTKHTVPFLHYTEEILTVLPELKYFAVPVEDGIVYPRGIALYVGDSFTTNNCSGAGDYAKVVGGVLTLQASAEGAIFKATASTLPSGEPAYEFLYIG